MLRDLTVGERKPPDHLGDDHLLAGVVALPQDRREAMMVDGVSTSLISDGEEARPFLRSEVEMSCEHALEVGALRVGKFAVRPRDLEEQRARRKVKGIRPGSCGSGRRRLSGLAGEHCAKGVEHVDLGLA